MYQFAKCKKIVLLSLICLAVVKIVSCKQFDFKRYRYYQKISFSKLSSKKANHHEASCNFDSFTIPCLWSNRVPQTVVNQSFSLRGRVDGYSWFAYSYWFQKTEVRLSLLSFFNVFKGNLLLVVYTSFKPLPQTSDGVPINLKNLTKTDENDEDSDEIDLSSKLTLSKFEYKTRVSRSEKYVSNNPIEIRFREYKSPVMEIENEGCISFKLRGDSHLSNSDSLNLWATKENDKVSRLLWSNYGPVSKLWHHYSIGLLAGNYTLSFNGSLFVRSRAVRVLFAYELDDIVVATSPCCQDCSKNKLVSIATGLAMFPLSQYTSKTCKWIGFTFETMPLVNVSVKAPSEDASVKITHNSRSGTNVCIERKAGSKNGIAQLFWIAKSQEEQYEDPKLIEDPKLTENDEDLKLTEKNKDFSAKTEKVYPLPTLPNEKNYAPKSFHRSLFDHLFASSLCNDNQFECYLECIPLQQRCDGKRDCLQGEDELNCNERFEFLLFSVFSVAFVLSVLLIGAHYACLDKSRQRCAVANTRLLPSDRRANREKVDICRIATVD